MAGYGVGSQKNREHNPEDPEYGIHNREVVFWHGFFLEAGSVIVSVQNVKSPHYLNLVRHFDLLASPVPRALLQLCKNVE